MLAQADQTQWNGRVPNKGMASDTWGNVSATRFRNTVNDSKMVTPVTEHSFENASDSKMGSWQLLIASASFALRSAYSNSNSSSNVLSFYFPFISLADCLNDFWLATLLDKQNTFLK